MNAFHALWHDDRLHIWAETTSYRPVRAGRHRLPGIPSHPFCIGRSALPEILKTWTGGGLLAGASFQELELSLPSEARGPVPSPALKPGSGSGEKKRWKVETLSLEPAAACEALLKMTGGEACWGDSLRFLRETARCALALIERGAFLAEFQTLRSESGKKISGIRLDLEDSFRVEAVVKGLTEAAPGVLFADAGNSLPAGVRVRSCLASLMRGWLMKRLHAAGAEKRPIQPLLDLMTQPRAEDTLPEALRSSQSSPAAASVEHGRDFRTWLRLVEPVSHDRPWHLAFELQSRSNPGLTIFPESLWAESFRLPRGVPETAQQLRDLMLADLARAASLFAPLAASLQQKIPAPAPLTARDAYFFLQQASLLLKAHGFGIRIPDWWHQKKNRVSLRLKLRPSGEAKPGEGLGTLVDYAWEVLAGGESLTLEEFREIVKLKMPLVRLGGRWVELRLQEIENALVYFSKAGSLGAKQMPASAALRSALEGDLAEVGFPVAEIQAEGWLRTLFARSAGEAMPEVPVPQSFQGTLRSYQKAGFSWMTWMQERGLGACLADDMGLGKTVQLLALLLHRLRANPGKKTLLVCPMSIVGNWHREASRFAPELKVWKHHGPERLAGDAFARAVQSQDLVITTYGLLTRDRETLALASWDLMVLDEAQNIKNEAALQTRAVKSLPARARIALTGTPMENNLGELWSILDFLNPGYLGPLEAFRTRFQIPVESRRAPVRLDTLRRMIAPFLLRRMKTDPDILPDLPEKMEMKMYCSLTSEQASLYGAVVQEMMGKISIADGIQRKGLILSALTRLKQVCNHPAQLLGDGSALAERSGKLNRLREMLEEVLAEGDKALVFTQYAEMGEMLTQDLSTVLGCEVFFLHGGTSSARREEMIQSFQSDPKAAPVFVLSTKAGGTGLNLTAASHVFHFDRWWNPSVENQATDRAHRIGQTRRVQVHKLIAAGTLEEKIDRMLEKKSALVEDVLAQGESFLTELSDAELREIMILNRDAVGE